MQGGRERVRKKEQNVNKGGCRERSEGRRERDVCVESSQCNGGERGWGSEQEKGARG